jgi:ATP-dependent RNA helicase SUPV3L1/SUV3
LWRGEAVARLEPGRDLLTPRLRLDRALDPLAAAARDELAGALDRWLEARVASHLAPLQRLARAAGAFESGPALRALALRLVEGGGALARDKADLEQLAPEQRGELRRLGVVTGALDLFVPAMLRIAPLTLWSQLATVVGLARPATAPTMPPVLGGREPAAGYRRVGQQWLRIDMAEKLLKGAHGARAMAGQKAGARRRFPLSPDLALSMGLTTASYARLLQAAGFRPILPRPLADELAGPAAPLLWEWRPERRGGHREGRQPPAPVARPENAFAVLAGWRAG